MFKIESAYRKCLSTEEVSKLYDIINHAYAETERVIWGDNYKRIERRFLDRCIDRDEVLVAFVDGKLVGGVRYFHLHDNSWSFSLLATDFDELGKGIGKELVVAAEDIVRSKGADSMKIEVLRPESVVVESKEQIAAWYKRMNYQLVKQIPLGDLYPEKIQLLKTPAVFDCYLKNLDE